MYLINYKLQKNWLDQCLKSAVSDHPLTVNMLKGLSQHIKRSCKICMAELLLYFFITLRETDLENASLTDV